MSEGHLTLTLRVGEEAEIDADGEKITIRYVKAIGQQKGSVQIVAPKHFRVRRNENDRVG